MVMMYGCNAGTNTEECEADGGDGGESVRETTCCASDAFFCVCWTPWRDANDANP